MASALMAMKLNAFPGKNVCQRNMLSYGLRTALSRVVGRLGKSNGSG